MSGWERKEDKRKIKIDGRKVIVVQRLKYTNVFNEHDYEMFN
jgi:hypothetical protein